MTISIIAVTPLQAVTPPLPAGDVATAYTATLVAKGGVTPYVWSIISGQLPLRAEAEVHHGIISGIPILKTTANFSVQVQDANLTKSAPQSLNIVINTGTAISNTLLSGPYSFLFQGFDSGGNVEMAGFSRPTAAALFRRAARQQSFGRDAGRVHGIVLYRNLQHRDRWPRDDATDHYEQQGCDEHHELHTG